MLLPSLALVLGLGLLIWSADRFVTASASIAHHFQMPALLVGMVVVGFGTSSPEITVSIIAAFQGTPGVALGNAYGSNIANIALILGIAALISPVAVHSQVLRKELPFLAAVTLISAWQISDGEISRLDAGVLIILFFLLIGWMIWRGLGDEPDPYGTELEQELQMRVIPVKRAVMWLIVGLVLLVISSRLLVWGAVRIAEGFGVSDLIIGLTIVAVGTSLPELASSVIAAQKGEHDIAVGNVIGSNLFNTLVVVGIAGMIHPMTLEREVFSRDMLVMSGLTLSLFVIGYGFRGYGRINRTEGTILVLCYFTYLVYLVLSVVKSA